MNQAIDMAKQAIYTFTHGMDTANWDLAVSPLQDHIDVDYAAVGGPKAAMSRQAVREFLNGLLGKPDLLVQTAISQVMPVPAQPGEFIAYYSARHFRGPVGAAEKFSVFGWYHFAMTNGKVSSLTVEVLGMEGSPGVLA